MFTHTKCRKITATAPVCNRLVLKLLRETGFTREGTNKKSWLKHGLIYDQASFGIVRE
jgi:hypothetical protein